MSLDIQRWNYIEDSTRADHIGPVAQEFNEAFGLGSNETTISTADEIGVALAAVQELNRKFERLDEIVQLQSQFISSLLESIVLTSSSEETNTEQIKLFQNAPNPYSTTTEIRMIIPSSIGSAVLVIYDASGRQLIKAEIMDRGSVNFLLNAHSLAAGLYFYTVIGDGRTASVKRMIIAD